MRRVTLVVFGLALFLASFAPIAVHAENSFEVSVGTSSVNEEGFDSAVKLGAEYLHRMGSSDVYFGFNAATAEYKTEGGSMTTIPIGLVSRYQVPLEGKIKPYLSGGVAYYLNEAESPAIEDAVGMVDEFCYNAYFCPDFNLAAEINLKDTVGFHLGGGVDFYMTDRLILSLGAVYRIASADLSVEITCSGGSCPTMVLDEMGVFSESVDLGGFDMNAGIKLLF